jgi:formylglycine-generating enzyme required for sulfatase activity
MDARLVKITLGCLPFVFFMLFAQGCKRIPETRYTPQVITTPGGVEMVLIQGGYFKMGNNRGQPDEAPAHRVWISPFLMDKYEVIQQQFRRLEISDPSHFKDPNNPLEQMNWTDAAIYCNERSYSEGLELCYDEKTWDCNFNANGYRLPTEAEWEYACRAGTNTDYSFGNNKQLLSDYAWYSENSSAKTHNTGQKKPNPWGLYDMHGNVTEWCNDYYAKDYYKNSPEKNPKGPAKGKERVIRGGSWNSTPNACRSTYRSSDPSINDTCLSSDTIGFRAVRKAPEKLTQLKPQDKNIDQDKLPTALLYD